MADINMSVDEATEMILKTQNEMMTCLEQMDVMMDHMEHQHRIIEAAQESFKKAKNNLAVLKVHNGILKTKIEICRKIREVKSKISDS